MKALSESEESAEGDVEGLKDCEGEDDEQEQGGYVDHRLEKLGKLEFSRDGNLVDDGLGLDHVTDQEAGQNCHDGHHHAIGDEVEEGENVHSERRDSGPCAEAQRGGNADDETSAEHDEAGDLSLNVEFILNDRHHRFHQRNGGGEGCKQNQNEEDRADQIADGTHFVEHLGKGNEHEPGALVQTLDSRIADHRGDDHESCKECNAHIKKLDLVSGGFQRDVLFHVRAVGDHNSHRQRHGIEQLPHGGNHRHDGEVGKIGL